MKKIVITLAAVFAAFGGTTLLYFALTSLNDGGNILFFVGTFVLFGTAIYLFMAVTKETQIQSIYKIPSVTKEEAEKTLAEKNKLANEYGRINDARKKLKMLEAAGNAEEEALS